MMKSLISFILFVGILYVGRSIFTPLLLALFLWYLTNSISAYYRKVIPDKKLFKKEPKIISKTLDITAFVLSIATIAGSLYLFIMNIRPMFSELVNRLPELQYKMNLFIQYLAGQFGFSLDSFVMPDLMSTFTNAGLNAVGAAVAFGMVLVYMLFMFIEQSTFSSKFKALFPDNRQSKKVSFIIKSIDSNMKRYLFVKTSISAVTALASYLWLNYLGLEFAVVWAFIIFVTSYIPTFGAIIACVLPITYALVVSGGYSMPVLVGVGLIILQILFGNIIEPRLMGKTLNISTLAILINLVFWGILWGPIGMFFSVPLLVATLVITAQFDSTRWIAVLLSANGEIPAKED